MHHFFFVYSFRYHCNQCDDFDLCYTCYSREGHPHSLEKLGFDLGSTAEADPDRVTAIQRCINSLVHASQCHMPSVSCHMPSCYKIKVVFSHTRLCKPKSDGECLICRQLLSLCCYHAKQCEDSKCSVSFCQNIKQKLQEQQLNQKQAQTPDQTNKQTNQKQELAKKKMELTHSKVINIFFIFNIHSWEFNFLTNQLLF